MSEGNKLAQSQQSKNSDNSKFFTGALQLSQEAEIGIGDTACELVKIATAIHYADGTLNQIGCIALAKVNIDVYLTGEEIGKMLPRQERHKVNACCAKNSICLRELEKSEAFAQAKRGIWLPKIVKLVEKVVDQLQANQVDIVVVYMSSGGHAVLAREFILMLRKSWSSGRIVVVLSKPYNDPLCETIFGNNKIFCIKEGLISIEFESVLEEKSFFVRDFVNCLALHTLLNENKTALQKSAQDMLGLMDRQKQYALQVVVRTNPKCKKIGWFSDKIGDHHDLVVDVIKRGIESIGVNTEALYTITGNATDAQVLDAVAQIGMGDNDFHLNYRLLPQPKNMDSILIGKFEPC